MYKFIAELFVYTHAASSQTHSTCFSTCKVENLPMGGGGKGEGERGMRLNHPHKKGYLHVSEGPVLHGEVSWEVVCEVVGITSRVGCAHRAYHLLEHARVRVLLGHMISKPRLREPNLATQGTCEGSRLLCAVILATKEEICGNKGRGENTSDSLD